MAERSERVGEMMINATKTKIDKIFSEIQNENAGYISVENGNKSMEEVINILLSNHVSVSANELLQTQKTNIDNNRLFDIDEMMLWRNNNNNIYQLRTHWTVVSHRKWIGDLIVFGKKVVRKFLKWYIDPIAEQQTKINGSFTASINALCNNEIVTEAQFVQIQEQFKSIENKYDEKLNELENHYQIKLQEMQENYLNALEAFKIKNIAQSYETINYLNFEEYFRGDEQKIKKNQAVYVPYFEGKNTVLDLGCGRGEFLELLQEKNIPAIGVDTYEVFVEQCRNKNLTVIHADAIAYLEQQKDNSLGGIFTAQLVEHLSISNVVSLCNLAYQKLENDGYIIIETPNPSCMSTYLNSFYLDPTHTKPLHPKTLEFFLCEAGFKNIEIVYTEQSKIAYRLPLLNGAEIINLEEFNDGINFLSDIVFGSQDYAIIAKK